MREPYTNWFTHELWLPIEAVMKQHKNHTVALKYLRIAHCTKGISTRPYDKLSQGSLNEWSTTSGEIRGHVSACVAREHAFVPQCQHIPPVQLHMKVTIELVELLYNMREACVFLHAGIVQPIIIVSIFSTLSISCSYFSHPRLYLKQTNKNLNVKKELNNQYTYI